MQLTLINVVLDLFPKYVMSLFPIPISVVKKMDKLNKILFGLLTSRERGIIWSNGRLQNIKRRVGF